MKQSALRLLRVKQYTLLATYETYLFYLYLLLPGVFQLGSGYCRNVSRLQYQHI